ncbi:DUF2218 domain-containing protein [Streptomyces sp. NPDC047081]|uniref:DUF2218 domain-containing protein n=1 Tax=Streptomyces sp. NPDC047081 TaxID=3154706 RepID=UPI0033F528BB
MPTAEARVETERASRYLGQLCRHTQQMGRHPHYGQGGGSHRFPQVHDADWSDTHGTVRMSLGQWTLQATPDALVLRIEAANQADLQQMRDLITARVEKIGRRDRLTVAWQPTESPGTIPDTSGRADASHPKRRGHFGGATRRWTLGTVLGVVVLMVAAHLVLGGSLLAATRWWGWGAGAVVVAIILAKVIGMVGYVAHRRRRRTP